MTSERRKVNFRDSPPGGGGSSPSSRYTSDSGVGSLSDQASRSSARPAANDVQSQWDDLPALQEAYRVVFESKERWKDKARRLDDDAVQARKGTKEADAKWRAVVTHNEQLESDKAKMLREKKALADEAGRLQDDNADLRQKLAEAHALIEQLRRNSPPLMSGANQGSGHGARPRRSSSKRESSKDQKQRLEKRFEARETDVKSESTSSSSKGTRSSHRGSYIEPFGPGASSTTTAPPPTAGRAHYATYSESTQQPPTFARTEEPAFSAVPRSVRGHVDIDADHPAYSVGARRYTEDGTYHAYPLPSEQSRQGHHRSSRGSR